MSELEQFRKMIEVFDRDIVQTIAQRMEVARQIGVIKQKEGKPIEDKAREKSIRELHAQWAEEFGVDDEFIDALFGFIIAESRKIQSEGQTDKK